MRQLFLSREKFVRREGDAMLFDGISELNGEMPRLENARTGASGVCLRP